MAKRNPKTGRFDKTEEKQQRPKEDAIASADYVDWLAKEQEHQRLRRQDEIHQANSLREAMEEKVSPADLREAILPTPAEAAASIDEAIAAVRYAMDDTPIPPVPTPPVVMSPRVERRLRWMVSVMLAVALVAGGLMGAAAKDRELRPTIHLLRHTLDVVGSDAFQERVATRVQVEQLREENVRLNLERGGAIQTIDQARDTAKAAAHDLRRADRALQYDQSVDRVSDRAKTWVALRAVEKAERRLTGP